MITSDRKVQTACDKCTQGVMDNTNPHLWGECPCECHKKRIVASGATGNLPSMQRPVNPAFSEVDQVTMAGGPETYDGLLARYLQERGDGLEDYPGYEVLASMPVAK